MQLIADKAVNTTYMNVLFLCIGSEKISGDSLGPIVGTLLREKYKLPYPVIGCEDMPVNGVNIDKYKNYVHRFFPAHRIIAIDAALGDKGDIGRIRYRRGGVRAGGALGLNNQPVGELAILGVVGERGGEPMQTLLNTPFERVVSLAERIAQAINEVFGVKELSAV